MPDGVTHFISNCALGGAMIGTVLIMQPALLAPVTIGAIAGLVITPDFDLEGKSITETALYIIPPIGWLWQQLWFGYALAFRHRGASHNLLLGTLGRVLWSLLIVCVVTVFISGLLQLFGLHYNPLTTMREFGIILLNPVLLAAWWAQDAMHILLDAL